MKAFRYSLILIIILVGAFSLAYVQFYSSEETPAENQARENVPRPVKHFGENDLIHLNLNSEGDADGKLIARMGKSKFTETIELSISKLTEEDTEKTYLKSVRNSLALEGIEVENGSCKIRGIGENDPLTVTVQWDSPNVARKTENHWEIKFDWIDEQAAAREVFSTTRDDWVMLRNISETFGFPRARLKISSVMNLLLPEKAQNIDSAEQEFKFSCGGGTYSKTSTYLDQISGRSTFVENEVTIISSENKITSSPENLIENIVPYTISYDRAPPKCWNFYDSVNSVRLDLKYGREFKEKYVFPLENASQIMLEPGQILYLLAEKVLSSESETDFSIKQNVPKTKITQDSPSDFDACWKKFSKEEYLSLAQKTIDRIDSGKDLEGGLETSAGRLGAHDILYTFTRVLSSYERGGGLPEVIKFVPVPHRKLTFRDTEVASDLAYYLMPSRNVITNSSMIRDILSEYQISELTNRELAKKLLEWTHKNLSYQALSFGKTSEETLEEEQGKCVDYTNVYLALLRSVGIPSRKVSGWVVSDWQPPEGWSFIVGHTPEGDPIAGHAWTQVYLPEEGWVYADPTAGTFDSLEYDIYTSVEQSWVSCLSAYETKFGAL